jgi:hypothetical protein
LHGYGWTRTFCCETHSMSEVVVPSFAEFFSRLDTSSWSEELRANLRTGLEKMYNSPPREEVSTLLEKDLSPDFVRAMLFCPTTEHMSYYPLLIMPPPGNNPDHPLAKVRSSSLHAFYLSSLFVFVFRRRDLSFLSCILCTQRIGRRSDPLLSQEDWGP